VNEPNNGRIDQAASDAIQRVERQMVRDGKLNESIAVEGAGILFLPVVLAALAGLSVLLGFLGFSDEGRVVVGAGIVVAASFYACYRLAVRFTNRPGPRP